MTMKDSSNSTGGWNRIAIVKKLAVDPQIHSGYVGKVTINYLVDDINGADTLRASFPFGHMFIASYASSLETINSEANMVNPDHMVDVTCKDGGAGTATLYLNRRIVHNDDDTDEYDGQIHLWAKNTDLTVDDDIIMRYYIETWGRWVETTLV